MAWRVRHAELGREMPELLREPGHAGVTLWLWLEGLPVGRLEYLAAELPVAPAALRAAVPRAIAAAVGDRLFGLGFEGALPVRGTPERAVPDLGAILSSHDLLAAFGAAVAAPPSGAEDLSVFICTRDRPDRLALCLDSLEANLPFIGEIIVVDNGARPEETRAVTAGRQKMVFVAEPRPGLSIARNTGVRLARHAIAAFTDDDLVRATLGDYLTDQLLTVKGAEWQDYRAHVSPWELARYANA